MSLAINSTNPAPTLYVEGEADFFFVQELSSKHSVGSNWVIERKNGFASVMKATKSAVIKRGGPAVGVVVDADLCLETRWKEICNHLTMGEVADHRQIEIPEQPVSEGTIIEEENGMPRIGIWVMPDNASSGELEDFLAKMVRPDDPIWPLAKNYINRIPHCDRRFQSTKIERATFYAWLATCEKPPYVGYAIQNDELNSQILCCFSFVGWLKRLFAA